MTERVPSFFMLVPGPWRDSRELVLALRERGVSADPAGAGPIAPGHISVDIVEDDQLAAAFKWGRSGALQDELLARVAGCTRAALIECGFRLDEAPGRVAELGRALREAGGVLVRMEASGSASAWEPWLEQLDSGIARRIYASAVLLVRDDDDVMFTCGMHQFDLPDAQIASRDPSEAMAWLDEFCVYQLAEQPALLSGHTFRPDEDAPRRKFERWPDHRHRPNDGRHNPFGLWRFLEPGESGLDAGELAIVIMPPLVTQFMAAERSRGRPLTRSEVESLVKDSPAIALEPAVALELERAAGYADIEPGRAWEQWQLIREAEG